MSFGFIPSCRKIPWEAVGYLLKYFFFHLIGGSYSFMPESLEAGSKPYSTGSTFL